MSIKVAGSGDFLTGVFSPISFLGATSGLHHGNGASRKAQGL
jgi:hypothetical protein